MARSDGRIEPGQKIRSAISARAWNRAQDAADIVLGGRPATLGQPFSNASPWGYVEMMLRNDSVSRELETYTVAEVTGVANQRSHIPQGTVSSGGAAYGSAPILTGVFPTANIKNNYVVTLQTIQPQQIGRVAVAGCVPCMVNGAYYSSGPPGIPSEHSYASPLPNQQILLAGVTGSSRILYSMPGLSGLSMIMLHRGTECVLAYNNGTSWPIKTKQTLNVVTGYLPNYSGAGTRDLDYDPTDPARTVEAWNFLADITQPTCLNVLMPFFNDEYILVQSSFFTYHQFDNLNDRMDALESRVAAIEAAH